MLDRIEFLLGEGLSAFKRNGWMTVAAISTAAIALFIIGSLGYVFSELKGYVGQLSGRYTMRAYLKTGATYADITQTAKTIRKIEGIKTVVWIPKERAWEKEQERNPDLTKGIDNPLPDGYKITLSNLDRAATVIHDVEAIPAIDREAGVQYMADELQILTSAMAVIRWIGIPLAALGLIMAGVLVYNAIRLTVIARRREIRIMQLVGASYGTIRVPFLIEGVLQGSFGGSIAGLLMWLAHHMLRTKFYEQTAFDTLPPFPVWQAVALLAALGGIYGFFCSGVAVRSPLKLGAAAP